ncbi:uncharacterized protein LOC105639629 isoform X2 [Jatropha curcas]|nr:uncharacterized protein LOC105639629 isoform X2 [Jatropha curcas]
MFFHGIVRRRIASLLQPWLLEEPEFELELGLINSRISSKNLSFDSSALNRLLDDSSRFSFKEVSVEEVSVRFSNWSVPAFKIEVRGLSVTLLAGEEKESSSMRSRKSSEKVYEEKKKAVAEIDPEGSALHNVLERILVSTPTRNRFTTSLLNLVLKHCHLQIFSTNLQVQVPILNDALVCLLELKEFNGESQYFQHGCILRGFVGAIFNPVKETTIVINFGGFGIGYEVENMKNSLVTSTDLSSCIELNDLQLAEFSILVPELNISFSPLDLLVLSTFENLLSKKSKGTRNGRHLWRLAANRLGYVISSPRLSLHNLVELVCLWLRYLNAYEHLLSFIGYSTVNTLKKPAVEIFRDNLSSVAHNWELISRIEKELPVEAIAQARRVARYRAALNIQHDQSGHMESSIYSWFKIFSIILSVLVITWKFICRIFLLIVHGFLSIKFFLQEQKFDGHKRIISEDHCPQYCFLLNFGKISITLSPANKMQNIDEKMELNIGIPHSDVHSFCLSIDAVLLVYVDEIFGQSLTISCGQLKVKSFSVIGATIMDSCLKHHISSVKGNRSRRVDNLKTVLWGEPAQIFSPSQSSETSAVGQAESACSPHLKILLGEMWSAWKRAHTKYEENEIEYLQKPWLLFEIKNKLIYTGPKSPDPGFWKCCLVVGKLNVALGYLSVISMAILLGQIKHALTWTEDNGRGSVLSHPTPTTEEFSWEGKYEGFVTRLKLNLLRMLPGKSIQLGVFITGPHIQMSMRKIESKNGKKNMHYTVGQDDINLGFDIQNIEAVVRPTSKSDLALTQLPGFADAETECHRSREPKIIEIPKSDNEKYASQICVSLRSYLRVNGLNIYMGDSTDIQESQILILKPIAFQLSFFRECVHSFSSTITAFSAALCGRASGFTVISHMDELHALFQVIAYLFSVVSYAFDSFHKIGYMPPRDFIRQSKVLPKPDNDESTAEGAPLIYNSTLFSVNATFHFKTVDVILQNSRLCDKGENWKKVFDTFSHQKLYAHDFHDYGIWFSVHHAGVDMSYEERKVEVLFDLLGIQSVIFRYRDHMGKSFDHFVVRNLQRHSNYWLYELSLSNFTLSLGLGHPHDRMSNSLNNSTLGGDAYSLNIEENSHLITDSETSSAQSHTLGFASSTSASTSSQWILINVSLSGIFVGRHSIKNVVIGARQVNKFTSLLSVGGDLQTISWRIQGGHLFVETTASVIFARCFALYLHCLTSVLSTVKISAKQVENAEHDVQEIPQETQQSCWEMPETSTVDVSQFSLILLIENDSGGFQELVTELDVFVKLESINVQRRFTFELSRMSIFSQVLQESAKNENQFPHFSSAMSNESSSHFTARDPAVGFHHMDGSHANPRNYILNKLVASISAAKPKNGPLPLDHVWIGNGSVSGFDMTISLSEILMFSSIVPSFSGGYNKKGTNDLKQRSWSSNQAEKRLEDMVPNGAIVAIQDVHEHMYFAVEGENNYTLVGVIHYSLVGEKALFRVKHHKQKIWSSSVLWFSLISLHAKNDSGEPLRLNYRPGSVVVDISSTNDNRWSLWRALSNEPESYKGDVELEPYNNLVRNKFYLINKKNDCAVAFIDGIPEFVRKPGNPFKFKLFQDHTLSHNIITSDRYSLETSGVNLHSRVQKEDRTSYQSGKLPCVQIEIDNLNLTIVNELQDSKDRFPLLRGCIKSAEINVQILSYKTRVMSTSCASLYYFYAQRNSWRELVRPVKICIFYRSSSQILSLETVHRGVPVHVYCRTKEWDISLTEVSLDILLLVIGELNLAGPFSVRNSLISANCCKVENQTGLNLLCNFYDNKSVTIARKQSASVFLRQPVLASKPPEGAPFVTVQLSNLGSFSTSSLHLSLLKSQTLAWRTRIVSVSDSRAYPGPFVIVDISRKSKDGLSIAVSPLTRIHNGTEFSVELRFRRPQEDENVFASMLLKKGDSIDDSMATFDAINLSGGSKKALMSLSIGNFLFSFRPEISDDLSNSKRALSVEWSDELKGGKAVCLSGIFDKLSYKVRRALSAESIKCSFSTAYCTLRSEDASINNLHFLIQSIRRDVPMIHPDKSSDSSEGINSAVALQEQKEIFLLPTVRVSNLLHSEIHVLLTETALHTTSVSDNIGKEATIACGSTADFYANPALIYFTITLTAVRSSCKPVNSGDWIKKLIKNKNDVHCLEIDLDFGGGKYFALLRLSRGFRGTLEAAIFTPYSLRNNTDFPLFFCAPNQKPLSRGEVRNLGSSIPPELGLFCPPNSIRSWFLKSHKMQLKLLEDHSSEVLLDLDALSGVSELSLEIIEESGLKFITKFGVSIGPSSSVVEVPSQIVTMTPRHVIYNESEETITIRQCYVEDGMAHMSYINSKERKILRLQNCIGKSKEFSIFENVIRKHRHDIDTSSVYIQFQLNDSESGWSGPLCIASLGCFFLKFRKQSNPVQALSNNTTEFASVHVIEEGSSLGLHFYKPPNVNLPYRIENHLRDASLTYYQKDSSEQEVLGSDSVAHYVWDDLVLPHKLVVIINDMHLLREINLDKVRAWKPFRKLKQHRGLASLSLSDKKPRDQKDYFGQLKSTDIVNIGYEIYAEGPTRVLRICEFSSSQKENIVVQSCAKVQLRVYHFAIHLLEDGKQDLDNNEEPCYTPFIVARLGNINLDSIITDQQKYNQISLQSLNIDQKWTGAPFAAVLRRHQLDSIDSNVPVLKVVFILLSNNSNVRQVKYLSIILQPIDLNLDEETLIRLASFWRTSLSDSSAPSQRYYFDHFEVHPIKIITNFLPGDSYSSYDSAQETLRSLLHSVVKVPPIKNMVVELNGVLVTHALITMRELFIRCAQHYSWYAMRAIYIAKGSPLLPPAFVSIFDDLASSSLDVFFDPSRGLLNLPGFTLDTFKFISKTIGGKGFSGTKRYFGDLEKTLRTVGSNVLFAAVTEISDSIVKGAERSGFDGMVSGFHQGIMKLAMEPSLLGTALMEGGPDRKIKLDRSPGIDELYIEGYLQAMLDTMYRQEYLRVRVIDDQVFLKNLPPNSALIDEIMDRVKGFLINKALLKGDSSVSSRPLRHLGGESEWKIGPTLMTLCEHLFVSFAIRILREQTGKLVANIKWKKETEVEDDRAIVPADTSEQEHKVKFIWKWGIGKFVFSGILAYIDGRLCRGIPNPIARRIVSGYLLSFLDRSDTK